VLLDASIKVLPLPQYELTVVATNKTANDYAYISGLARRALPVTAAAVWGHTQYIRLSGTELAVKSAAKQLDGDIDDSIGHGASSFWSQLRDQTLDFFNTDKTLWRISVSDYADVLPLEGEWLYDWSGAQRWLCTDEPPERVFAEAASAGGHATRYGTDNTVTRFQPLTGAALKLQRRLRDSFDADQLFNPGHFHPELNLAPQEASQSAIASN